MTIIIFKTLTVLCSCDLDAFLTASPTALLIILSSIDSCFGRSQILLKYSEEHSSIRNMDTSINITASQIETLQTALLMERQDRNALQHRVQELEEVIRVLGTKFQHTSKERDDEIAKSNLFSDYVSEIRSPALIIRTVTALLKYPSIHVVCLLKVSSEWAVISDRSDDHIFIESSQLDDVIDFFEKQTVSIDRVSALPPSVVNAINLAYEKKFDSIQTSNNNMIFSAISRDTIWVVVSDLSLQPLLETFLGLSALLLIATRLIIEAFKRQLEDIEILETSLIRKASDQVFQELFLTSDIVCSKDLKEKLQSLLQIVNSLYTSCSSELFIVDGNKVALTSQLAYISLAQCESSSVLLTAISEQRLALCMDPLNAHRNRLLDCGNVVAPIPIILALPLWTSDNKSSATSNSNCQAFLLLRIFDNFNPTQYVKLAEDLVAGIGAMLQFWTRQHMHILLTHRSLEEDFERRPPLNQRDFLTSAIEGLKSLTGSSNILTVANLIQCSWLIFIELGVEFGDEACLSSENLCMYNDIGEKRSFQLSETKNEFRGFLNSLFGIIDDGLYSHSSRSGDEGSLHLLNGMKVRGSGLQSLLRITIPEIVNLVRPCCVSVGCCYLLC